MQPRRSQSDEHVAGLNRFAGDDLLAIDHAHDEACQVVLAVGVEAGHLGSLAADQRAAIVLAGIGNAGDHFLGDFGLQLAGGEVVHEEHGRRALHGNVVDAVVHQISADGVVQVHLEGDLQLGAHAIDAGDQHRIERTSSCRWRTARRSRRSRLTRLD